MYMKQYFKTDILAAEMADLRLTPYCTLACNLLTLYTALKW